MAFMVEALPAIGDMLGGGGLLSSLFGGSGLVEAAGGLGGMMSGLGGLGGITNVIGGLTGLFGSNRISNLAQLPSPGQVTSIPGYQAGLDAVQRSMAAQGYQGSGNMMAALSKYGGDAYNQYVQQRLASAQGQMAPLQAQMSSLGLLTSGIPKLMGWGTPGGYSNQWALGPNAGPQPDWSLGPNAGPQLGP